MNFTQQLFSRLPDNTQVSIANNLLKYDLMHRLPLFKMFFRTLEAFGAERDEMRSALRMADNFNGSFSRSWINMAEEMFEKGRDAEHSNALVEAKEHYLRATLYHLVADWPLVHSDKKQQNYAKAMSCFEDFKRFHLPQINKVRLPFRKGSIMANIRFPRNLRKPCPAVIIFQGNDSVKEFMVMVEDYALERGIATLTVDQPGFGESGMTGNLLDSNRAAMSCIRNSINYLKTHPKVDHSGIGAFGFSFGGFTALYSAGLSKRVHAVATIGAPMRLRKVFKHLSFLMRQRTYQWSGCRSSVEINRLLKHMNIEEVFSSIKCPAYIIHGTDDEVVDQSEALSILNSLQGESRMDFITGGDHTCSLHLDEVLPEVFDWFGQQLRSN